MNVTAGFRDLISDATPISLAIVYGDDAIVKALLRFRFENGPAGRYPDDDWTLHWAAGHAEFDLVRSLLDLGTDPNVHDAHGSTSLHCGVEALSPEVLGLLLQRGADRDAKDSDGLDALQLLERMKGGDTQRKDACRRLLER